MGNISGITETNRKYLTQLHRRVGSLVEMEEAAQLLELDRIHAAKLFVQLAEQGWARRLRRGLCVLVPLEATSPENWTEAVSDPTLTLIDALDDPIWGGGMRHVAHILSWRAIASSAD